MKIRFYHYVDYSVFNMQLEYRDDYTTDNLDKVNGYGMRYIESHLDECEEVDMFNIPL